MAIVLNSENGKVIDRTDELQVIPDAGYITSALGLFQDDPRSQKNIQIVRRKFGTNVLTDRNWDERDNVIVQGERDYLNLQIPHIPAKDSITPNDIDGIAQAPSLTDAIELETVASVRADKMVALRNAHDLTLEVARMQLITSGDIYAPNGTVKGNFYTEFGVDRTEQAIDFGGTTSPYPAIRTALNASRRAISDGRAGGIRDFVVLCGSEFFSALMSNAFVVNTAQQAHPTYESLLLQAPPNDAALSDARYQSTRLFGAMWVDVGAGGYTRNDGTFVPFIADGEAYVLPRGVNNLFKTYYAPANRFNFINRTAQPLYWFEYLNEKDDIIEIITQQNFLNACLFPEAVVKLTMA